jgi:hypothetical protein
MSVKGSTAMDLSLTTFVAAVVGCCAVTCFDSQNLAASSVKSETAMAASPAASKMRLRRDLGNAPPVMRRVAFQDSQQGCSPT